jgi:hypothetical protein
MFARSGLSLDQAPPIKVVFRFFLTGALWGVVGGILLWIWGDSPLDIHSPQALALTHIFTLGIMLSFMIGALFQMLPVLAGISLVEPVKLSTRSHWLTLVGTILLIVSFFHPETEISLLSALILFSAILPASNRMFRRLVDLDGHSDSSRGMTLAVFGLILTVSLGVVLLSMRGGIVDSGTYIPIRDAHIGFGIFGWISLLVISVSLQVVEMFYVAPSYPDSVSRYLVPSIICILLISFLSIWFSDTLHRVLFVPVYLLVALYAIVTIRNLYHRKRPLFEATVLFWYLSMFSSIVSMVIFFVGSFVDLPDMVQKAGYILFFSFGSGVVMAMSYKIVPFLVWFHLNNDGYLDAPMMHEVVKPSYALFQAKIHIASLVLAFVWLLFPHTAPLFSLALVISFGWLAFAIYRAWRIYAYTLENGKRFDFGSFS